MALELSRQDARRLAVRAALLDAPPPTDLVEVIRRLTFVQVEPTAAVAPTADLVLWSRLGSGYDPQDVRNGLDRDGTLFELDLLIRPMEDLALFRAEMAEWPVRESMRIWLDDNQEFRDDVMDRLEMDGPLTARDIDDTSIVSWPSSGWNNNRNVMMMLECLMKRGEVAVVGRRGRDRLWDLAERVYHADIPTVPLDDALALRARRRLASQGIVGERTPDLPVETTRVGSAGVSATVEGVRGRWRVDPELLDEPFRPRTALLSPFDALIRDRKRMSELFEFDYALEMYKPASKRRWGYYALPILEGDRLIGKVDAITNHEAGRLEVAAIHGDSPFNAETASHVRAELEGLASWLGIRLVLPR